MLEYAAFGTALLVQIVTVVVWGVRQEGKIKLQEERVDSLKELINVKFDAVDVRLARIERSLNGALRRE